MHLPSIPYPPDLSEILGIETKSYQPSSIYCQEPEYSSDQDGKTQNVTKRNYKNLKDNGQTTS